MIKNFRLLDGYQLNASDGYQFATNWVDLLNCMELSVSVVFVGGSPDGYVSLMTSNDVPDSVNGFVPLSAWQQASPKVRNQPALDSNTVPGSVLTVNGDGVYTISVQNMCPRWFQVVFNVSVDSVSTVTVMYNAKTDHG